MTGTYFFDAVTLSNFALAGRVDLLVGRYGQAAVVTSEVLSELSEGAVRGYGALASIISAVERGELGRTDSLSEQERAVFQRLLRALGPGEASCVACAKLRSGTVVTDDRAARATCRDEGVPSTGTIGILKACCLDGALDPNAADEVLAAMVDAGYFSPVQRISDLL